ncbi:MAG: AI-2E family transporter [Desulfarculus sp.]|jgi:predicted PurR-regulated permease PerM|nr:MAG: AI-2E family transporter [Desulfarculus sp.]
MHSLNENKPFATAASRWFFGVAILLVLYLSYLLVRPFLVPIFLAVVLAVVGGPLYNKVLWLVGRRRTLAAALTVFLFLVIIVLPLYFITGVIASQALDLYNTVSRELQGNTLQQSLQQGLGHLGPWLDRLQDSLGLSKADLLQQVGELVRKVSNLLYSNLAGLLKGITNLVIDFVLMMIVTFYLLIDGHAAAERLLGLSPLPESMSRQMRDEVLSIMRSTFTGTVVLALLQGVLGGLGFWIFGVPNAPFWGTVMVFSSVVPLVGTALVWVPAGVYLMMAGHLGQGVGVMIWCLVAGVACDNFLRPKLISGASGLHPVLVFFSVLGGLSLFGVVGLLLGPMVLALLLSLLEVYRLHILHISGEADQAPAKPEATE